MVAYSFKTRFVPAIVSGVKQGTIRQVGLKRHATPAEAVQFYTGMRTQNCRLIGRATCLSMERVVLRLRLNRVDYSDVRHTVTTDRDLESFARRDGFASWHDLAAFWDRHYPGVKEFVGVHIVWGNTFVPATIMQTA